MAAGFLYGLGLLIVFTGSLAASPESEKKARLQFEANTLVKWSTEVEMKLTESFAGQTRSQQGTQHSILDLSILNSELDLPVLKPPFEVALVPRSLQIRWEANGKEAAVYSDGSSIYEHLFSKMMHHPLCLKVEEGFSPKGLSLKLDGCTQNLPWLRHVPLESILNDVFFPLFALAGQELQEGIEIERWNLAFLGSLTPANMLYTITAIDDYSIHATLSSSCEGVPVNLKSQFKLETAVEDCITLPPSTAVSRFKEQANAPEKELPFAFQGSLKGQGKWNRNNSLLADLTLEYSLSTSGQLEGRDWRLQIELKVHHHSKRP